MANEAKKNTEMAAKIKSKVAMIERERSNSVSIENWRISNQPVRRIHIPQTQLSELRLTNNGRKIIRRLLELTLRSSIITNINYNKIFIKRNLDIWFGIPEYKNVRWSEPENGNEKVGYLKQIGSIITQFVTGGNPTAEMPKDVKKLIEYLNQFDDENIGHEKFQMRVVLCHSSLMRHATLLFWAVYLFNTVIDELQSGPGGKRLETNTPELSGRLSDTIKKEFGGFPYKDVADINDEWMRRASSNPSIGYLQDAVCKIKDRSLTSSVFGYLLFMRYAVDYLLDDCFNTSSSSPIDKEEVDDYLYIMYPEYMPTLIRILVENNLVPAFDVI